MFARFDENPAMTLRVIKETKRYGRTDGRTDARTDGQRENSIPPTNKVCGGYEYYTEKKSYALEKVSFSFYNHNVLRNRQTFTRKYLMFENLHPSCLVSYKFLGRLKLRLILRAEQGEGQILQFEKKPPSVCLRFPGYVNSISAMLGYLI